MTSLNDRAVLVSLSISQWSARKLDKGVTSEVNTAKRASSSAGRYNKSLLPMDDLLADIHKKTAVIRDRLTKNTLPWGINDSRILPSSNYLSFMTEFKNEKVDWFRLVDRFLNDYNDLAFIKAPRLLGDLYDPADYPTEDQVRDKFKISMAVMPVPSDDFRVSLADDELDRIRQEMQDHLQTAQQEAMSECWNRLFKHVQHITEKLADPKGIFRDSMIDNAVETCGLLSRLNVTGDPNLEAMRREVEDKLLGHHPDTLRKAVDVRQSVADDAEQIMARMKAFMGVPAQ